MNDPRVLSVFSVVFALLGAYNVSVGRRRKREAEVRGQHIIWYKQINLLLGTEFLLLALVFLITTGLNTGFIGKNLAGVAALFYVGLLLATVVVAVLVVRQNISNARQLRAKGATQAVKSIGVSKAVKETTQDDLTPEERAAEMQRRRERRRNAAAARRRRAGKA